MRTGEQVPGIMTEGILFITDDPIADAVEEYDSDARLAVDTTNNELVIVRFVRNQKWAPGGTWIMAFRAMDGTTGDYLTTPPDGRILEQVRKYDTHASQNRKAQEDRIEFVLLQRELARQAAIRDRARDTAERTVHKYRKLKGQKRKIFVP